MKSYNINVFVRTEEQLKTVLKYDVLDIYTDNLELQEKNPRIYYKPLKGEKRNLPNNLLTEDTGVLYLYGKQKNIVTDYSLNVANKSTIKLLEQFGAKRITLSLELSKEEMTFFSDLNKAPVEIYLYGTPEVMLLKRHPLFLEGEYLLEDQRKRQYPIRVSKDKMVHIYHFKPIDRIHDIQAYLEMGVYNFRIDFLKESSTDIENVFKRIGLKKK